MTKVIRGHKDYYITDSGEVISEKRDELRVLIPDISNGYPRVTLDGERRYIADLVAEAFLTKPYGNRYKIFYVDGNKENCSVNNLRYLTESEIKMFSQYSVEYRKQVLGEWA